MKTIQLFLNIFLPIVFIFFTVSCANLVKKKKDIGIGSSDIDGINAKDIVNKDVDSDNRGSDSGIEGFNTVIFAYDSSELSEVSKKVLKSNVDWIKENEKATRIELEGHCDSMGSEAYNIGLGLKRAQTVKTFLISLGVSEDRLSLISYGEERPISSDNSKNRRVNFIPIY